MALQWAPNHDNEAGYVDVLPNKAGESVAMVTPIRYPVYIPAGDRTMKAKGDAFCELEMLNVTFADYTSMRETDLGFTSSENDISKEITISLLEPDQVTWNDWNVIVIHRPGVDTELNTTGAWYARVYWFIVIVEAT